MRKTLLLAALAALWASHADAHARLIRATPRVGQTVAQAPAELRLWFSESIDLSASRVTLTDAGGHEAPTGRLALDPKDHRVVIVPLPAALPPGAYRVRWSMLSQDTHRTDGDFTFKVGI